jgi:hypothetical protein
MDTSTDHTLNVNAVAGIARGARAAACLRMSGLAEFTDGSLAVRWMR